MGAVAGQQEVRLLRRVAVASLIGTLIEWYDFFLYAAMAALVFNHVFFPAMDDTAGTLASFATFGAGYVARPIGSLVMGHFGDRVGRKAAMVTSLLLMGGGTLAIGLVPSYASIGIAAPAILTVLRFAQGVALGGEWSGAVTLAMEHAPAGKRGWWAAWVQYGALAGIALSSGTVYLLVKVLDPAQLFSWGWRIPFLASGVLFLIGLFVRLRIEESPVFRALAAREATARVPAWNALRDHAGAVARVAGMHLVVVAYATTLLTYVLGYGVKVVGHSRPDMLLIVFLGTASTALIAPCFGGLSDRFGRRRVYLLATGLAAAGVFPSFALLNTGGMFAGILAVLCLGLPIGLTFQAQGAYFPEQFPPLARVTGAGLGASLGSAAVGGPAPAVAQALSRAADGKPWLVAAYLCAVALVSFGCAMITPDPAPGRAEPELRDKWVSARRANATTVPEGRKAPSAPVG